MNQNPPETRLFLVGAGPGHPQQVTLRARECLAHADVVLYTDMTRHTAFAHTPPSAEMIYVGPLPEGNGLDESDVAAWIVRTAGSGRTIVRLYPGDPHESAFFQAELAAYSAAELAWELVPGLPGEPTPSDPSRPLSGQCVLVTRARAIGDRLWERLVELGAQVHVQPAIRITAPSDWRPVDSALDRLGSYDWLVFSSANGVRSLLERLIASGGDLRRLGRVKLAAIGPGTADELLRWGLRADLIPDEFRAESLADALLPEAAGRRFLLARASRGREVLADRLSSTGAQVTQIVVYQSEDVDQPQPEVKAWLKAGRIDWTTVTSSAIARSLVRLFGPDLRRTRLASISPVTSETLREMGYPPSAEATQYTMDGVVAAIVRGPTLD
jgi:uroporphyrinogen-III synthase